MTYEAVTASRREVGGTTGEGEAVTPIAVGDVGSDKRSALGSRLYDDGRIGHTGNNAVALEKVGPLGLSMAEILGKQSATIDHLSCCVAMCRWVYAVEAMGQDAYCRESVLHCCAMSTDVNAIGQATHDEYIGTLSSKVAYKAFAQIAPIVGTFTGSYDTYYAAGIERSIATIEE